MQRADVQLGGITVFNGSSHWKRGILRVEHPPAAPAAGLVSWVPFISSRKNHNRELPPGVRRPILRPPSPPSSGWWARSGCSPAMKISISTAMRTHPFSTNQKSGSHPRRWRSPRPSRCNRSYGSPIATEYRYTRFRPERSRLWRIGTQLLRVAVVVDLDRMNRILEVNEANAFSCVEPGVGATSICIGSSRSTG